jgi:K+-sensing histidine kinase KdpD
MQTLPLTPDAAGPASPPADDLAAAALPIAARYGLALAMVAAATVVAFVVDHLIAAPNLSLIFVLPVVVAAALMGWGPALTAALAGVAAFDFFFVQPRYSMAVDNPTDLWALSLLLVIAAAVSSVGAQSRRRALEAREAADRADALRALAHAVINAAEPREVTRAAALALSRVFRAPAVVLLEKDGALALAARAGDATLSAADEAAARLSLASDLATRGGVYPAQEASFDFWPIASSGGVLGVQLDDADKGRPAEPEKLVEIIGAYLAVALQARGRG